MGKPHICAWNSRQRKKEGKKRKSPHIIKKKNKITLLVSSSTGFYLIFPWKVLNKNRWNKYLHWFKSRSTSDISARKTVYLHQSSYRFTLQETSPSPITHNLPFIRSPAPSHVDKNKLLLIIISKRIQDSKNIIFKVSVSDFSFDVCCEYANKLQISHRVSRQRAAVIGCLNVDWVLAWVIILSRVASIALRLKRSLNDAPLTYYLSLLHIFKLKQYRNFQKTLFFNVMKTFLMTSNNAFENRKREK